MWWSTEVKVVIEFSMIYTTEGFTYNSSMSSVKYVTVKIYIASKLLHQFTEKLDVKPKTDLRRYVLIDQSAIQSEQVVCCGLVFQNDSSVPK